MSSQPVNHSRTGQYPLQESQAPENQAFEYQTPEEKAEESRRSRVMQVIEQDRSLPVERASALVADARRAALAMFPEKAAAFDMLWWPRLQRIMRERYRMQ
jgi:hypothetical protein